MANHPRMIGADGSFLVVPMPLAAMTVAVVMAGLMNRRQIPVHIVLRNRIAPPPTQHPRFMRAFFACADRSAEFLVHREKGGRHAAPRGLSANRASHWSVKVA